MATSCSLQEMQIELSKMLYINFSPENPLQLALARCLISAFYVHFGVFKELRASSERLGDIYDGKSSFDDK